MEVTGREGVRLHFLMLRIFSPGRICRHGISALVVPNTWHNQFSIFIIGFLCLAISLLHSLPTSLSSAWLFQFSDRHGFYDGQLLYVSIAQLEDAGGLQSLTLACTVCIASRIVNSYHQRYNPRQASGNSSPSDGRVSSDGKAFGDSELSMQWRISCMPMA